MAVRRVLVLEDEGMIAESLRSDLEGMGVSVLGPAGNCAAALEILWRERPDFAILDTHLGSETCEVVLEECRAQDIPVVIFSAHAPEELPVFAAGLETLAKPYLAEHLSAVVVAERQPKR